MINVQVETLVSLELEVLPDEGNDPAYLLISINLKNSGSEPTSEIEILILTYVIISLFHYGRVPRRLQPHLHLAGCSR